MPLKYRINQHDPESVISNKPHINNTINDGINTKHTIKITKRASAMLLNVALTTLRSPCLRAPLCVLFIKCRSFDYFGYRHNLNNDVSRELDVGI